MKKIRHRTIISMILSLILLLSLSITGCSSDGSSNNGQSGDNAPVNDSIVDDIVSKGYVEIGCKKDVPGLSLYNESSGTYEGIETDLAYSIAAEIFDCTVSSAKANGLVHFVPVTVDNREQKLKYGDFDILLATYTITSERAEKFALSDSYYTDFIGIMVKNVGYDSNSMGYDGINSIDDLDGKMIGVALKSTTRDSFISYIEKMDNESVNPVFCEYSSFAKMYEALMNGDVDAISVDTSILKYYKNDKTRLLNIRFGYQKYGAAVTKENESLIDIVNKCIKEEGLNDDE